MAAENPLEVIPLKTPSFNLPSYWLSIHSVAKQVPELAGKPELERQIIEENFKSLLLEVEDYPIGLWAKFCAFTGVTLPSLIVASWCKGCTLGDFILFSKSVNYDYLNMKEEDEDLLRSSNIGILENNRLSFLLDKAGSVQSAALIIRLFNIVGIAIEQDLPFEKFDRMNDNLKKLFVFPDKDV